MNSIDVTVKQASGHYLAESGSLQIEIPPDRAQKVAGRPKVRMGIRPEDIWLVDADEPGTIKGEVYIVELLGCDDVLDIRVGEQSLLVLTDPERRIRPGHVVNLRFNTAAARFSDAETEHALLWN
jgi:ABC-type sugar transport system ATPase subunit